MNWITVTTLLILLVACDGTDKQKRTPRPSVVVTQELIDKINEKDLGWKAGWNDVFNGWDNDMYLSVIDTSDTMESLAKEEKIKGYNMKREKRQAPDQSCDPIPESFDARFAWPYCPYLGSLNHQGTCSADGAISVAGAISDRICIHSYGRETPLISTQDVLECCSFCGGCAGGKGSTAWDYWVAAGIPTGGYGKTKGGCKPYLIDRLLPTAVGVCRLECEANYTKATLTEEKAFYKGVVSYNISTENIQREIMVNGPVVVIYTTYTDFYAYKAGVYTRGDFSIAVGRGHSKLIGWGHEGGTDYWLGVNTLGTSWGAKGMFKMERGANLGGIESLEISAGLPQYYLPPINIVKDANQTVDIVLLIDVFVIKDHFESAIAQMVRYLDIQRDTGHNVAIIIFTDTIYIRLDLTAFTDIALFFLRLDQYLVIPPGGNNIPHRYDLGIEAARNLLTTQSRFPAKCVIISIVGPTIDPSHYEAIKEQAALCKENYVHLTILGIDSCDKVLLSCIASRDLSRFIVDYEVANVDYSRLYYTLPVLLVDITIGISTCAPRMIMNGLRHHPVPGECDTFYICRYSEDKEPIYNHCPQGLFWDTNTLTCNWPASVNCKWDLCRRDTSTRFWAVPGRCRLYWECTNNQATILHCCDPGKSFNPTSETCEDDATCTDENCQRTIKCKHDLWVTFYNATLEDKSHHRSIVDNYGVTFMEDARETGELSDEYAQDDWVASFDGSNHLTVTFFANNYYGDFVQMHVRFLPETGVIAYPDVLEILVTNGGVAESEPSLFIGYDRQGARVVAIVRTEKDTSQFAIDVIDNKYSEIWVTYDGTRVTLTTLDADGSKFARGRFNSGWVKRVHNAIHIGGKAGSTFKYAGFRGVIDEVWISRCEVENV